MKAIVAVDENWAIGNQGELLVSIPEDQKGVFRAHTLDHTVVFGRKTLETFPKQMLLPRRKNLIMSRNSSFAKEGAEIIHSNEALFAYSKAHPDEEIFVIGGAEVYRGLIEFCDEAIVTRIHHSFAADAYFPKLCDDTAWSLKERTATQYSVIGMAFHVEKYIRNK